MADKKKFEKFEKFERLSRDEEGSTKIMAGHVQFTIKQLEDEMIDDKSEIGKRLRSIEKELDKY